MVKVPDKFTLPFARTTTLSVAVVVLLSVRLGMTCASKSRFWFPAPSMKRVPCVIVSVAASPTVKLPSTLMFDSVASVAWALSASVTAPEAESVSTFVTKSRFPCVMVRVPERFRLLFARTTTSSVAVVVLLMVRLGMIWSSRSRFWFAAPLSVSVPWVMVIVDRSPTVTLPEAMTLFRLTRKVRALLVRVMAPSVTSCLLFVSRFK